MKTVNLGTDIEVDVQKLIDTRLLIQANSGGGKSYAIRKLIEATNGKVQQIVLDIEGDFSSLREEFDFVLAGKGGDISADPKHAAFLARKILELKADIIIDLYELKQTDRIRFVKLFLDSMVNAPKDLWHPALVVIDEAHIFAPEKNQAESSGAVIDICTRGRKRGYCTVLATQRLSKLHKDAAAECNNKLIGRTGLDIDLKRAGDELGFTSANAALLRNLEPGEFYIYGPAISRTVVKAKIGKTITSHPKAGSKNIDHKPAASSTVKSVLSKLGEVAREAENEALTIADFKSQIKELQRQLKAQPKPEIDRGGLERAVEATKKDFQRQFTKKMKSIAADMKRTMTNYIDSKLTDEEYNPQLDPPKFIPVITTPKVAIVQGPTARVAGETTLGQCERKIIGFLASQPDRSFSKVQVGAMTGYAHSSGSFNNSVSRLSQISYIVRDGGALRIADAGLDWVSENGAEVPHKLEDWVAKLGACERKIYEVVLADPVSEWSKQEIAEMTGYSGESGSFNNSVSRLNTLGLIQKANGGKIRLNMEVVEALS